MLMTYVGDEDVAAPQLRTYRPDPDEAEELFRQVLRNVELFLYRNVIHASRRTTSWSGRARWRSSTCRRRSIPKTGTPEDCSSATFSGSVPHFERFGVQHSTTQLTADLWTAWQFADLVPEELRGLV